MDLITRQLPTPHKYANLGPLEKLFDKNLKTLQKACLFKSKVKKVDCVRKQNNIFLMGKEWGMEALNEK